MSRNDLLGIGECMLELHDGGGQRLRLSYGGDVLNTLVYAQRSGLNTAFASITGSGYYGHWLVERWRAEGVDCRLVRNAQGVEPPMYLIRNDERGERTFHYWREASSFRALFEDAAYAAQLRDRSLETQFVYLSAITLAMLDDAGREQLLTILGQARSAGAEIVFDPNYRARLWPDVHSARYWVDLAYSHSTIALPSLEDEQALDQAEHLASQVLAERLLALGIQEVVIKNGEQGCEVYRPDEAPVHVPARRVARVVDTTSAGDAFNGAYIAARAAGQGGADAAESGASMAAYVIQHVGAIAPA